MTRQMLTDICGWFGEDADLPDLQAARRLMA